MPPSAVKTLRQLIFWQYAKIIAESAGFGKNYRFIMNRFKKTRLGRDRVVLLHTRMGA